MATFESRPDQKSRPRKHSTIRFPVESAEWFAFPGLLDVAEPATGFRLWQAVASFRRGSIVATELNLNSLNWVTLACRSCESSVEVLAEDLAIADSIRCPGCGLTISDQTREDDASDSPRGFVPGEGS
ncbi:MAG: hypothetical protein O2820_26605 [Planctomycetota bacterium]|nr:hypothetical protein [Planctomycetota bacterium]